MFSVTSNSTILSQNYPSIATMNGIHNRITLDANKVQPFYLAIQPYLSPLYSPSTSLSPSLQSSQDFSLNTSTPSFNQNILDSTTMHSHFPNPTGPYTPRLYNPLQHQQGIWSYSRLHQYYLLYSGISSNDSTSSISPDDHSSLSTSSLSNTSASFQTRK